MEVETFHSVKETGRVLGISDGLTKRLLREHKLLSVRIGDRRSIPSSAIRQFQQQLVQEAEDERVGAA